MISLIRYEKRGNSASGYMVLKLLRPRLTREFRSKNDKDVLKYFLSPCTGCEIYFIGLLSI